MKDLLQPIQKESLKDIFVSKFEHLILSGKLSIGEKLPSERELAAQLEVSRPVVHEGLLELASRDLVTIIPRRGTVVNDYRKHGSITMLTSLLNYTNGTLDPHLLTNLFEMRALFEIETTRLAVVNATNENIDDITNLSNKEHKTDYNDLQTIIEMDFEFHHLIAIASGNLIYPLLMNSFKPIYTNLTGQFFRIQSVIPIVHGFHKELADSIEKRDSNSAVAVMKRILEHGEDFLRQYIKHIKSNEAVRTKDLIYHR